MSFKLTNKFRILLLSSLALIALLHLFGDMLLVQLTVPRYHMRNRLLDTRLLCTLRKIPALFSVTSRQWLVVWESNCDFGTVELRWRKRPLLSSVRDNNTTTAHDSEPSTLWSEWSRSTVTSPTQLDKTHFAYNATLGPLPPSGRWLIQYELLNHHEHSESSASFHDSYLSRKKLFGPTIVKHLASGAVRVALVGDNQWNVRRFAVVTKSLAKYHPDYLGHVGDAVQECDSLQQWQTDFYEPLQQATVDDDLGATTLQSTSAADLNDLEDTDYPYRHTTISSTRSLLSRTPLLYARGNHDECAKFPYAPDPLKFGWSRTRLGNDIQFIVLNSNLDLPEQYDWLVEQLKLPEVRSARQIIVLVHIAPFIEFWDDGSWRSGEDRWGAFIREKYVPLLNEARASLIIGGHQHNYQRGERTVGVEDDDRAAIEKVKTTYAIIGGAGGPLDTNRVVNYNFYKRTIFAHHFVIMDIDSRGRIDWRAYEARGDRLIDRFVLEPRPQSSPV